MLLPRPRLLLATSALALVVAAGCSEKTDVSAGTEDFNQQLRPEGLSLACPKQVSGGEGTQFDCTLKGEGNKSATVKLKIVKEGDELAVDVVDQPSFDQARKSVAGG